MKILKFLIPLFLFVSAGYGQFVAPRSSVWSFPLQPPTDTVRSGSYTDTSTSNYGINGIALRTERWLTYFLNNPVSAILQNVGQINFSNGQTIDATTAGTLTINTRTNVKPGITVGESSVTDGNIRFLSSGGVSYVSLNPATLTAIRTIYFPDTPGTVLVRTGTFLSSNNGTVNVDSINLVTLGRWQTQTPTLTNSFLQTAFGTGWAAGGASKMAFNNGAIINTSGGGLSVNVQTDFLASLRVGNPAISLGFVDIYNAVNYQKFRLTTTTLTADRSATFGDTSGIVPLHVYPPLYQTANGNIWLDTTGLGGASGDSTGANKQLSNIANTSIGADLVPTSISYQGQRSLGTAAAPWLNVRSNYHILVNQISGKLTTISQPGGQTNATNNVSVGDTSGTIALTGTNGFSISTKGVGTIDTTSTISSKWYAREYYVAYLRSGASVDTVQYSIAGMTTSGIVMVGFQDTRASGSPVWECRNGSVWIKSTYHGEPDSVKTIIHVLAK